MVLFYRNKIRIIKWDQVKSQNSSGTVLRYTSCVLFFKYFRTYGNLILIIFSDALWNHSVKLDHNVKAGFLPVLIFTHLRTYFLLGQSASRTMALSSVNIRCKAPRCQDSQTVFLSNISVPGRQTGWIWCQNQTMVISQ